MTNSTSVLTVDNLSYRFETCNRYLFQNIQLLVSAGQSVAITGLSGAGKTTLLQLISGLSPLQSGSIQILGKSLAQLTSQDVVSMRRQDIGFIYQNAHLLNALSVYENIALPGMCLQQTPAVLAARVQHLIDAFDLSHCIQSLPHLLSGGEKARVCIARALVNKPQLLFADEPTGNLDAVNVKRVADYILGLKASRTAVIVITHDLGLAQAFDVHYKLHNGVLSLARE